MKNVYLNRWVKAGEVKTHYLTSGEGEPVILLHGGGPGVSAVHQWRHNMGPLADAGFSVYAPEVVGYGLTDKPANGNSMEAKVKHVKDFIDALCLEKVFLVGNSLGGMISHGVAIDWPDRVKRLVLLGGGAIRSRQPPQGLKNLIDYSPSKENIRSICESLCLDPSFVTDEMVEQRYQMSLLPGAQEAFQAFMDRLKNGTWLGDMENRLGEITTPTLLIWGKQDRMVPLDLGKKLEKQLPNARLEVVENAGHWVQIEHSQKFNALTIEFFQAAR